MKNRIMNGEIACKLCNNVNWMHYLDGEKWYDGYSWFYEEKEIERNYECLWKKDGTLKRNWIFFPMFYNNFNYMILFHGTHTTPNIKRHCLANMHSRPLLSDKHFNLNLIEITSHTIVWIIHSIVNIDNRTIQ